MIGLSLLLGTTPRGVPEIRISFGKVMAEAPAWATAALTQ